MHCTGRISSWCCKHGGAVSSSWLARAALSSRLSEACSEAVLVQLVGGRAYAVNECAVDICVRVQRLAGVRA